MKSNTRASVPFVQWLVENFPPHVDTAQIPPDELPLELRCIYHFVSDMVYDLRDQVISLNSSEYDLLTVLHDRVYADEEASEALKYAVRLYRRDYKSEHHTPLRSDGRVQIMAYPRDYDPNKTEGLDPVDAADYVDDSRYFLEIGPCRHPLTFHKRELARDHVRDRKHALYHCDRCRRYVVSSNG